MPDAGKVIEISHGIVIAETSVYDRRQHPEFIITVPNRSTNTLLAIYYMARPTCS